MLSDSIYACGRVVVKNDAEYIVFRSGHLVWRSKVVGGHSDSMIGTYSRIWGNELMSRDINKASYL